MTNIKHEISTTTPVMTSISRPITVEWSTHQHQKLIISSYERY